LRQERQGVGVGRGHFREVIKNLTDEQGVESFQKKKYSYFYPLIISFRQGIPCIPVWESNQPNQGNPVNAGENPSPALNKGAKAVKNRTGIRSSKVNKSLF
jgi:hypothetical protein